MIEYLPNFFILGAAKCGTTSLYRYLSQHSSVYFPENKEPQFFCNEELYARGIDFYRETFFRKSNTFPARGDATPHYLFYPKSGVRIKKHLPTSSHRFIVILRDPVERAYSHYKNMLYEGYEKLSFAEALRMEPERIADPTWESLGTIRYSYFSASLYANQLRAYFDIFSRDCFLILFSQDLAKDPAFVMESVFSFLDLSPINIEAATRYNTASKPRSVRLQAMIRQPNRLRGMLGKLLPYKWKLRISKSLIKMNRQASDYEPIDPEIALELRSRFTSDIEELEIISGRNLSEWK